MAKSNTKTVWKWLLFGFGVAILLFLIGGIFYILDSTIVNRWVFFGIVAAVAAATGTVLHSAWDKLTGWGKFYLNYPLHIVVASIVLSSAFLMGNYFGTDFESLPEEKVIIEKRFTQTRYHTKRATRRVYTRGAPYKVYFLEVSLPDGKRTDVFVKKTVYDKALAGDTATVRFGRGVLSLPVLDPHSLTLLHPHSKSKKHRSRCKFFGTTRS